MIRMYETYVGSARWNSLLSTHLARRQYTNPDLDDLVTDLVKHIAEAFFAFFTL